MNDVNRWLRLPQHLLCTTVFQQRNNRGGLVPPSHRKEKSSWAPCCLGIHFLKSHHVNRHKDSVRYHSWTSSCAATGWHLARITVIHHHTPEAERRRGGGWCILSTGWKLHYSLECLLQHSFASGLPPWPGQMVNLPQSCGWRLPLPQKPGNCHKHSVMCTHPSHAF